jgi:8-oxo-dGTP pyrophosphatase MutT (NUDIX family)
MTMSPDRVEAVVEVFRRPGLLYVVDAFVLHPNDTKILMQKRAPNLRLFPNFWDPTGGFLKSGESVFLGLKRAISEEIGASLSQVHQMVHSFDWKDGEHSVRNLQFLVDVQNVEFRLDAPKVLAHKWFGWDDLDRESNCLTAQMREGLGKALQQAELLRR